MYVDELPCNLAVAWSCSNVARSSRSSLVDQTLFDRVARVDAVVSVSVSASVSVSYKYACCRETWVQCGWSRARGAARQDIAAAAAVAVAPQSQAAAAAAAEHVANARARASASASVNNCGCG